MDYAASQAPSGYAATQVNLDRRPSDTASHVSSRVSDWVDNSSGAMVPHHDAGTAVSRRTNPNPPPPANDDDGPRVIRRTVTTTTTTTWERKPSTSSEDGGVAGAVAGLLGAAVGMGVGAALTYGSMMGDEPAARAGPPEPSSRLLQPMSTARGPASERGDWVEVDRATELPQYLANYGYGGAPSAAGRSTASARPRTVVSATQGPLLLTAAEARSQAGSQYSRAPSNAPRGHTLVNGDGASQVSTRSRTTAKPPTKAPSHAGSRYTSAPHDMDSASRVSGRTHKSAAPSRHAAPSRAPSKAPSSASTVKAPSKAPTVIRASGASSSGRKGSTVSARGVPLPRSSAGSSHASRWDDLESIAPSESISCVDGPRSRMYC